MNREEYAAAVYEQYKRPPKEDHPNQKFPRGSRVKVCDEMPPWMTHFPSGFEAIVEYSYAQKYGGDDVTDYSLIQLSNENQPINGIAWYKSDQLTLLDDNIENGLKIIDIWKKETSD